VQAGDISEASRGSHHICVACCESEEYLIKPYNYNPEFKFYKTKVDKRNLLYFGIELEVESCNSNKKDMIKSLPDFVYVKSDSSINNGFEIVSHPMTYRWLNKYADKWNRILTNLRKKGYRSYDTTTCGMHIHLSKAAFSNFHLYKFMKMFYDNRNFVLNISQRAAGTLSQWASVSDSEKNIIYKAKNKAKGYEDRHTAINLERDNSVEIRIFRGTLCLPSFWKNIEFAKAMYDFSRDSSLELINEVGFRDFVRFRRKEFFNLHDFLWSKDKTKYKVEK